MLAKLGAVQGKILLSFYPNKNPFRGIVHNVY
jgi:hypothetical protein